MKFLPFSAYPLLEAVTGKDPAKIKPPAFFAPIKFGTSEFAAKKEIASIARIYAEGSLKAKFKNIYPTQSLYTHTAEILDAAKKNGYDPQKLLDGGISLARSKYYRDFADALKENDFDKAVDAADKLHSLNTKLSGLKSSVKGRFTKTEGVFKTPDSAMAQMITAWRAGYNKAKKRGVANYNVNL